MSKLTLLGILLFSLFACEHARGPKLQFEHNRHDFGTLFQGEIATHIFDFTNAGDSELIIKGIQASCGCTASKIWVEKLDGTRRYGEIQASGELLHVSPQEKGKLEISLNTASVQAEATEKTGMISIISNESQIENQKLHFTAKFEKPYSIEEPKIDLGTMAQKESKLIQRKVIATNPNGFEIISSRSSHPAIHVEFLKMNDGSNLYYDIAIQAGPDLPEGSFAGKIELETNLRTGYSITLPIYGVIEPDIVLNPPYLHFSTLRKGEAGSISTELRFTVPEKSLEISSVKIEGEEAENLQATIETLEPGKRFQLQLDASSQCSKPAFRGNLKVEVNWPKQRWLDIPYRGFVR